MQGPAWDKVRELLRGYPPEFNAMAAHRLLLQAWQMGFDLVRDEKAPARYIEDCNVIANAYRQATGYDSGLMNQASMNANLPKPQQK